MIKRSCDCCGDQLPEGDMGLSLVEFILTTKAKGPVKLRVSEVPPGGGPPSLAADVCAHCVIDAVVRMGDRPRDPAPGGYS